jgi:hypothetical protein
MKYEGRDEGRMRGAIEQIVAGRRPWRRHLVGAGHLLRDSAGLRLLTLDARPGAYSDAQVDDYQVGAAAPLIRRPPLRLRLRARFSHPAGGLRGTAGFGLWNYPQAWPPALPRAVWFFYASPPADMPLAQGVPGHGWKAATIDSGRPQALALLPLAPLAVPLMRSRTLSPKIWPPIQRAVGVAEALAPAAMDEWHEYTIVWGERTSTLSVDGAPALADAPSPRGPLCFVAWVDNQYLVATPQGRFAWGLLDAPGEQYLEFGGL